MHSHEELLKWAVGLLLGGNFFFIREILVKARENNEMLIRMSVQYKLMSKRLAALEKRVFSTSMGDDDDSSDEEES